MSMGVIEQLDEPRAHLRPAADAVRRDSSGDMNFLVGGGSRGGRRGFARPRRARASVVRGAVAPGAGHKWLRSGALGPATDRGRSRANVPPGRPTRPTADRGVLPRMYLGRPDFQLVGQGCLASPTSLSARSGGRRPTRRLDAVSHRRSQVALSAGGLHFAAPCCWGETAAASQPLVVGPGRRES